MEKSAIKADFFLLVIIKFTTYLITNYGNRNR